jgi:hypothetical protein
MANLIIGPDGWPVDSEAERRRQQRDLGGIMLLAYSRWRAGDTTAIAEAVRALIQDVGDARGAEVAEQWWWLVDAVAQLVDQRMPDDEKRFRREFAEHWSRWEAVTELHQRRNELLAHGDDRGKSLEKCYVAVAETTGDGYKAVKESYRLIERAGGEHVTLESFRRARATKSRAVKLQVFKNA